MGYSHTQHGRWHWLILLTAVLQLVLAYLVREHRLVACLLAGVSGLLFAAALSFRWLRVRDDGNALSVRFGPLPLFGKRFAYRSIADVRVDRTRLIDGWFIHYVPRRGWTYNIWGYDCVRFRHEDRIFRIGTDDAVKLASFLNSKTAG